MAIEEELAELLRKNNLTITIAESCTGGLVAGTLVNVPGISEYFQEGYVTYSNEAKQKLLGVQAQTLESYGAVSRQTAEEMALGCARAASADLGLATTGIAGPDGGTVQKPVGLVYIGCAFRGTVCVERFVFTGNRRSVREQAVEQALQLAKRMLASQQ